MKVINTKKIVKINLKFPELMADNAADKIKELEETKLALEDELSKARQVVHDLEVKCDEASKELRILSNFYTVEYETKEVKEIHEEVTFGIRGMGNSTLGTLSKV